MSIPEHYCSHLSKSLLVYLLIYLTYNDIHYQSCVGRGFSCRGDRDDKTDRQTRVKVNYSDLRLLQLLVIS